MIKIDDKRKCSGCTACASICPVKCISVMSDSDGFKYPVADPSICINCGLCEKVCPFLNPWIPLENISVFAMASNNRLELEKSSSGAVFAALARYILDNGGIVVGARYDLQWNVEHFVAHNVNEMNFLRGSKYIQSDIKTILPIVREYLKKGVQTLFSGTPCQIAGLKHFLRKDYDNLICVEMVCHGVPSPKAWQAYLSSLHVAPKFVNMRQRTKREGYSMAISGNLYNGASFSLCEHLSENLYLRGFLDNLYLRPSCFGCKAKNLRSHADITLGDFWTIAKFSSNWDNIPELVLVNTTKGNSILTQLIDFKKERLSPKSISEIGNYIQISATYTHKNAVFFSRIDHEDFQVIVSQLLKKSLFEKLLLKIRRFIIKTKSHS